MADLKGDRVLRAQGPGFAIALLFLIIAGGTLGFHWIEGWSLWRAFYGTVAAVTVPTTFTADVVPYVFLY